MATHARDVDKAASILMTGYNQDEYLIEAVKSAVNQTVPVDVVLVDDHSDTPARETLRDIRGVTKIARNPRNLGQKKSQLTAWKLAQEHGLINDVVLFLDGDDILEPDAVENVLPHFKEGVSKVQFQASVIDGNGEKNGAVFPKFPPGYSPADIHDDLNRTGNYQTPPTIGNAYASWFLKDFIPRNTDQRSPHDGIFATAAAIYGDVVTLEKPLGRYRVHSGNMSGQDELDLDKIRNDLDLDVERHLFFVTFTTKNPDLGVTIDRNALRMNLWVQERLQSLNRADGKSIEFHQTWRAIMKSNLGIKGKLLRLAWLFTLSFSPWPISKAAIELRFCSGKRGLLSKVIG